MSIALCQNIHRFTYPAEFVREVKERLPHDEQLQNLITCGSVFSVEKALEEAAPDLYRKFRHIWNNRKLETGFMLVS